MVHLKKIQILYNESKIPKATYMKIQNEQKIWKTRLKEDKNKIYHSNVPHQTAKIFDLVFELSHSMDARPHKMLNLWAFHVTASL